MRMRSRQNQRPAPIPIETTKVSSSHTPEKSEDSKMTTWSFGRSKKRSDSSIPVREYKIVKSRKLGRSDRMVKNLIKIL